MQAENATVSFVNKKSTNKFFKKWTEQRTLIILCLSFVIFIVVFGYLPLWGWLMAFQNYKYGVPFFEQQWVGLDNFIKLLTDVKFYYAFRNTIAMSALHLVFGTIMSILFAIILNEMSCKYYKKTVQTISFLPYFISWPVIANIVLTVLSEEGVVNNFLKSMGLIAAPLFFLGEKKMFWGIVTATQIWKYMGYGSIIYIGAMTSINPENYEAAKVDGAGRLSRIWHITLPGILPTVKIMTIINMGYLLNSEYELQYLLGNGLNINYSEVLDTFVLKYGLNLGRYSYATAAGVFKSFVAIILIFISNSIVKKLGEDKLF